MGSVGDYVAITLFYIRFSFVTSFGRPGLFFETPAIVSCYSSLGFGRRVSMVRVYLADRLIPL